MDIAPWMIERFFGAPLPEQRALLGMMAPGLWSQNPPERRTRLHEVLASLDLRPYREIIARQLVTTTRLDEIVPDVYANYRPVVADGLHYFFVHLRKERLVEICLDQMLLEPECPPGERMLVLVDRIPTLYKLGQIIARNQHVDASFRDWLVQLENERQTTTDDDLSTALGAAMTAAGPEVRWQLEGRPLAEASVAVVVGGRITGPAVSGGREVVIKVLRPHIREHLPEEIALLDDIGTWFAARRSAYNLPDLDFVALFAEVRSALQHETDLAAEQQHLAAAGHQYRASAGIAVPALMPGSGPGATVMSRLRGNKITTTPLTGSARRELARRLFQGLIGDPLFSTEPVALFHGDPHAGNLLVLETGNDPEAQPAIGLIDWTQTAALDRATRTALLDLGNGVIHHDAQRTWRALHRLARGAADSVPDPIALLSHLAAPEVRRGGMIEQTFALVDRLVTAGTRFPAPLLVLRKAWFTLAGVLHTLDADFAADLELAEYALPKVIAEMPWRVLAVWCPLLDHPQRYDSHLSNLDVIAWAHHATFEHTRHALAVQRDLMFGVRRAA